MKIEVWLSLTSQPLVYENIENAYQKGDFYCIYTKDNLSVTKFPMVTIFRIVETYNKVAKK